MLGILNQVTSISIEFERYCCFHCQNTKCKPSVSCFNWVKLSVISIPSFQIIPGFFKSDVCKEEPNHQSDNCYWVLWRYPKWIDHKESSQEIHTDQEHTVAKSSVSSMTSPYFPISPVLNSISSKPIIPFESNPFTQLQSKNNAWSVCQKNIMENVIPPTLSKVRENMLSWKLKNLIYHAPQME